MKIILSLFILVNLISLNSCKKENASLETVNLNGKSYTVGEFSASKTLNQLLFFSKNAKLIVQIVIFKGDTGVFSVKPNSPGMKKGEASVKIAIDGKVYFAQTGTVKIQKDNNIYSGEFDCSLVSMDEDHLDLNQISFKNVTASSVGYETVQDKEGNVYKTVKIGSQTWMAENLRSTKYSNGDVIPDVQVINDNPDFIVQFGRLYTWSAATNGITMEMTQGVCPDGWHIPSLSESKTLVQANGDTLIAGNNLKASVTWYDPYGYSSTSTLNDIQSNNTSGFTMVASGYKRGIENNNLGFAAYIWNSTNKEGRTPITIFTEDSGEVYLSDLTTNANFSVRCVKNN